MSRVVNWLQHHETRMFHFVNQRIQHFFLDHFFSRITHLGGATATIVISLCCALFGQGALQTAGFQALIALTISHIPVAIIKKKYPRLRPYLVHPQTITYKNPLTDHSFPSGHTTAIFSIIIPFIAAMPLLGIILLPLALIVGLSRIYLGLHYPSDCLVGSLIGTAASLTTVALWG
ncbi:phosphatase PAP2 family protein [Paenibacillus chondroitinus]|uniref:Phosphatase PAP2 family protein n=1 Tax=Paenibacillus chondroitinus TaxID=59842 RepID=A0ABU6DNR2_9BACL|nr:MULTISPECIES: phosphatase PAP2 family protein [Paenibacillus]MCY9660340.1 phosphatase PAP2 family protein [Paenibacillus anseongense]MEB4798965.1 phosphatase PAP2 family protein [Paenibacillus chondroitinus]